MTYTVCHAPLELLVRWHYRSVTIATMGLQTGMLSTLAEYVILISLRHHYDIIVVIVTYI